MSNSTSTSLLVGALLALTAATATATSPAGGGRDRGEPGGDGRDTGVGPTEVTGGCATGRSDAGLGGLGVVLAALARVRRRRR